MGSQYATFSKRALALFIDAFILLGVFAFISLFIALVIDKKSESFNFINAALQMAFTVTYLVFFQFKMGQTVGKRLVGIKVIDGVGNTPTLITLFLREVIGKFLSNITFGIGYVLVLKDPNKQALHDKIANTYVIQLKN